MDRRTFLRALALGTAGVACTRGGARLGGTVVPDPFADVASDLDRATRYEEILFPGRLEFVAGRTERVPLGIVAADGISDVGGEGRAWIGQGDAAAGPYPVTYRRYAAGAGIEGFYVSTMPMPADPGVAFILVEKDGRWDTAPIQLLARPQTPDVGESAPSVATPTTDDARGVANVCTRIPACPMHDVRLDRALERLRPVVLSIASPKFCTSRTCGPVVDEIVAVRAELGDRAAFVHAEVYRDDEPGVLSPTADAWRIASEPWTFVIDRDGAVAHRLEGPVVAAEVRQALSELL